MIDLFYDGAAFENLQQRGIQRYFREVITRLDAKYRPRIWICRSYHAELPNNCAFTIWPLKRRPRPFCFRIYWAFTKKPAIFHSTFFTQPPAGKYAIVQTLHDMIPEMVPEEANGGWELHIDAKRKALEQADMIISISAATAADAVKLYPQLASKIRIVHHGADHLQMGDATPTEGNPASQYALLVGERARYKNFGVVMKALALPTWPATLQLWVIGPPFSSDEQRDLSSSGRSQIVKHLGRPDDKELFHTMQRALAVIYPSLLEGFGFPILEAQASGTAILCGDVPVFREVGGVGPFYFNPRNPESLVASLEGVLNPSLRRTAVEAGRDNVRRFTWEKCTRQTEAVYEEAQKLKQAGR